MGGAGVPKLGVPLSGPYNKDYRILGSILGSPDFYDSTCDSIL